VLEGDLVDAIRDKAGRGWSIKAIVRATGVSRNAVRRYLRSPRRARTQTRPGARRLGENTRVEVQDLFRAAHENAAEVHRLLAARGMVVNVRTVQRAVADLRMPRADIPTGVPRSTVQAPASTSANLELARRLARGFRTYDRDELESELTLKLALLEPWRVRVKNWRAFLIKVLTNHAARWLGRQRKSDVAVSVHLQPSAATEYALDRNEVVRSDRDLADQVALGHVRRSLGQPLRRVWDAYVASNFNQTETAVLLGVHRSTVARALARIRQILKRHGF
jgi:RNA polymerase sigma factor (sigma-70 family)